MTTLAVGSRLGLYEIAAPLGAGGMGEVYRARDPRLERDVAIKILPPTLADPMALARFEREAKAVASLSHPNILAIHDFGSQGATAYAVMELLEGETLRERLAAGELPVRKTVEIALQIAQGLAAAHEKGIVHRDLKPDNVFITPNGRVKILDFGLAKVVSPGPEAAETIAATKDATTPGMVVGTLGYMSPEQITGTHVDHRTDIFAFGAIVYEMLTGRRAFGRGSSAETIAAILKEDAADVSSALGVPQPLERIVRRCLEKNPAERFHSAHDIGIALEALNDRTGISATLATARDPMVVRGRRAAVLGWAIAAIAAMTVAAVIWSGRAAPADASALRVRKFHIPAKRLVVNRHTRPVVSPDGQKVAFVAGDSLWIQELNQLDARQLATSWRPQNLFWSPDSAFVGFVSEHKLWKVSVSGGQPIGVADVPTIGGGALGTWRPDGKIVFSRSVASSGLLEVSQDGGEMTSMAPLQQGDVDFHDPVRLPGVNRYLLVIHGPDGPDNIAVLDGQRRKEILRLRGETLFYPQYSPTGHIVFGRTGKSDGVWAVPFDAARLQPTGEPFLVVAGAFWPSLSEEGTLTFIRRIWSEPRQLVVVNRSGAVERAIGEPQAGLNAPIISPDGRRVAVSVGTPPRRDLWVYDVERGGRTRLTFLERNLIPSAWTSRNRILFFYSVPGRLQDMVFAQPADGTGEAQKVVDGTWASMSSTAAFTVFVRRDESTDTDLDLHYRGADGASKVFVNRPGAQTGPQLSPDGAYVAYHSNESGRYEVYVKPFPGGAGQWQVSFSGGSDAHWSPRGDKLWFRAFGNALMEADVHRGATFAPAEPREVFKGDPIAVDLTGGYAVLGNGERFIAARSVPDPDGSAPSITVVQNWFAEFANRR
jgi:Tol biopolymer transport system component